MPTPTRPSIYTLYVRLDLVGVSDARMLVVADETAINILIVLKGGKGFDEIDTCVNFLDSLDY